MIIATMLTMAQTGPGSVSLDAALGTKHSGTGWAHGRPGRRHGRLGSAAARLGAPGARAGELTPQRRSKASRTHEADEHGAV